MVTRAAILLVSGLGLLTAGCAATGTLSSSPGPNFNGPVLASRSTVVKPTLPTVTLVKPKTPASMNVPTDWIPSARPREWRWIVIHHSASASGSAAVFDRAHRINGWDELGYHFVIGNGSQSGNGLVEVGPRWPKQKWGAHAKTADNQYNELGIGICLVGNFDQTRPTQAQLQSLAKLVAYMQKTYKIPADRVIGHRDTKPTDCPGSNMNIASVRRMAAQMLADSNETLAGSDLATGVTDPSKELMVNVGGR